MASRPKVKKPNERKVSKRRSDTSVADDEDAYRYGFYPADSERFKKFRKEMCDEIKKNIKNVLESLQAQSSPNNMEANLKKWSIQNTEDIYPHTGAVAYSVPPFHLNIENVVRSDIPNAYVCKLQESDIRGDKAQCTVLRAFTLLNNEFETEGKETMFIIGSQLYENMLIWLTNAPQEFGNDYIRENCPDVCKKRSDSRYFSLPSDSAKERHELDVLILHKEKGILFIQVKAVGEHGLERKIEHAVRQLTDDISILKTMMRQDLRSSITAVVAVPNIKRCDINALIEKNRKLRKIVLHESTSNREQTVTRSSSREKSLEMDVTFLCQEDLQVENISGAESEIDNTNLKRWWNVLETKQENLDAIFKDIIFRYVGILSTPVKFKKDKDRSRVRNLKDALMWTVFRFKRLVVTREQQIILKEQNLSRVYISGPPGSGKTMTLVCKAEMFLREKTDNHVVVINMYRGTPGRAIGHVIYDAISASSSSSASSANIHHIEFDVNSELKFTEISHLRRKDSKNILFVVDEIHDPLFCGRVLQTLCDEFQESLVWCAGIMGKKTGVFEERRLKTILRCPPAIQSVLYQVDWDESRKTYYMPDTAHLETPNGPTALSIRHAEHDSSSITECRECARYLANLLKDKLNIISAQEGAGSPSQYVLQCKIVVIVNIPKVFHEEENAYLEICQQRLLGYMDVIEKCPFLSTLREETFQTATVINPCDKERIKSMNNPSGLIVTWVDTFLGLESDVVIYLPGDSWQGQTTSRPNLRSSGPANTLSRLLPAFGISLKSSKRETREKSPPERKFEKRSPKDRKLQEKQKDPTKDPQKHPTKDPQKDPQKDPTKGFASLYWRSTDIQRYTDWDKTGLFLAASGCVSQLILLVP